jgi:hypothetical protein
MSELLQAAKNKVSVFSYPSADLPQIQNEPAPKNWMLIECGPFTARGSFEAAYALFVGLVQFHDVAGRHRWIGGYPDWRLQVWIPRCPEIYQHAIAALRVAGIPVIFSSPE